MDKEKKDKIRIIIGNLNSLADKIRTLPEEQDVAGSLPVISAALRLQAGCLKELLEDDIPDSEQI